VSGKARKENGLEEALRGVAQVAQELREIMAETRPSAADIASIPAAHAPWDRLLMDIDEVLMQVFVAGLAYPDPELAGELGVLSDRAREHGLSSAGEGIDRLRLLLLEIGASDDLLERRDLARRAWDEAQVFLAWLRLFRVEADLLQVQSQLERDAMSTGVAIAPARVPTATLTAAPLGLHLEDNGRLVFWCVDTDTGQSVLFHDHLAEWDRESPLRRPAISRLFQDSVLLIDILSGMIRTEDHPVSVRRGSSVFRPAFATIPRSYALLETPENPTGLHGLQRVTLRCRYSRGVLVTDPELVGSATLEFNLLKLMSREGRAEVDLDGLLLRHRGEDVLLNARTDFDDRVFPAQDTGVFRLARSTVYARACKTDERLGEGSVVGFWVRVAACLLHGATQAEVDTLRSSLGGRRAVGVVQHFQLGFAAALLGEVHHPRGILSTLRIALSIGAQVAADIDPVELALVLGQQAASAADSHRVDGDFLYRCLWLVDSCGLGSEVGPELEGLWEARYAGELQHPTYGDVMARALLMVLLGDGGDEGNDEAAAFLGAHLTDLGSGRDGVSPGLDQWLQLADTHARVLGLDRHGETILQLDDDARERWVPVARAILDWSLELESGGASPQVVLRAADAIAVAVAAGFQRLLTS
jgi:hypothetical protein